MHGKQSRAYYRAVAANLPASSARTLVNLGRSASQLIRTLSSEATRFLDSLSIVKKTCESGMSTSPPDQNSQNERSDSPSPALCCPLLLLFRSKYVPAIRSNNFLEQTTYEDVGRSTREGSFASVTFSQLDWSLHPTYRHLSKRRLACCLQPSRVDGSRDKQAQVREEVKALWIPQSSHFLDTRAAFHPQSVSYRINGP